MGAKKNKLYFFNYGFLHLLDLISAFFRLPDMMVSLWYSGFRFGINTMVQCDGNGKELDVVHSRYLNARAKG
jgi:hypothetical protein